MAHSSLSLTSFSPSASQKCTPITATSITFSLLPLLCKLLSFSETLLSFHAFLSILLSVSTCSGLPYNSLFPPSSTLTNFCFILSKAQLPYTIRLWLCLQEGWPTCGVCYKWYGQSLYVACDTSGRDWCYQYPRWLGLCLHCAQMYEFVSHSTWDFISVYIHRLCPSSPLWAFPSHPCCNTDSTHSCDIISWGRQILSRAAPLDCSNLDLLMLKELNG